MYSVTERGGDGGGGGGGGEGDDDDDDDEKGITLLGCSIIYYETMSSATC